MQVTAASSIETTTLTGALRGTYRERLEAAALARLASIGAPPVVAAIAGADACLGRCGEQR